MHPAYKMEDALSESDIHGLIAVLGGIIPEPLTYTDQTLTGESHSSHTRTCCEFTHTRRLAGYIPTAIGFCRDFLANHKTQELETSGLSEIDVLRHKSTKCWAAVTKALNTRSVTAKIPVSLISIRNQWALLGRNLKKSKLELNDEEIRSAFPALSRCGWSKCLCSAYKPAHPLRACKGCWRVAYCGSKCQKAYVYTVFVVADA